MNVGEFVKFSAVITAFGEFDLYGTGQAATYHGVIQEIVGAQALDDLLAAFQRATNGLSGSAAETALRSEVFSDPRLGPLARNILKMWFVGTWYELPSEWRAAYGIHLKDTTHVISPAAYTEGLLWPTIGANPSGAKAPGFGSWQYPPKVSPDLGGRYTPPEMSTQPLPTEQGG